MSLHTFNHFNFLKLQLQTMFVYVIVGVMFDVHKCDSMNIIVINKSSGKNAHLGYGDPLIGFCPYFLQDQKSEGSPSFFTLLTFSPILTVTTVFSTIFLRHAQHI